MQLLKGALNIAHSILAKLDLRAHHATHPRLGIIDHISCSPLHPVDDLQPAARLAGQLGKPMTAS